MAGMFVPQMVAPVDTSGLANLGQSIGRWREESELARLMQGFDPYDPSSRAETIHRLATSGIPGGRDMSERMLGTFDALRKEQQAQLERKEARTDEQNRQLRIEQALEKYSRPSTGISSIPPAGGGAIPAIPAQPAEDSEGSRLWHSIGEGRAPAAPPAAAAPGPGAAAKPPAPVAAATIATQPGGRPRPITQAEVEAEGLYEPTKAAEATARATQQQAAADVGPPAEVAPGVRVARGELATRPGGAQPQFGAGPLPPPPVRPPGAISPETAAMPTPRPRPAAAPAPDRPPAATVPAPAAPAVEPPAAPAAPAAAAPAVSPSTPRESTLPAIGLPKVTEEPVTPKEIELENDIRGLTIRAQDAKTSGEQLAFKSMIEGKKADLEQLKSGRNEAEKLARETRSKSQWRVLEKDIDNRSEFVKEARDNADKASNISNSLEVMLEIARRPGFLSGPWAQNMLPYMQMANQADQMVRNASGGKFNLGELMGDPKWLEKVKDNASALRSFQQIHSVLVQLQAGKLGGQFATADLKFTQQQYADLKDDPRSAEKIILMQLAQQKRIQNVGELAAFAERSGRSNAELRDKVSAYLKHDRSFVDKNGKLTALGREIVGDQAQIEAYEAAEKARISGQARKEPVPGAGTSQPDKNAPPLSRGEAAASISNTVLGANIGSLFTPTPDTSRNLNRGGYSGPGAPLPPASAMPEYRGPGAPLPAVPDYSGPGAPLPPAPGYQGPGAPLPPSPAPPTTVSPIVPPTQTRFAPGPGGSQIPLPPIPPPAPIPPANTGFFRRRTPEDYRGATGRGAVRGGFTTPDDVSTQLAVTRMAAAMAPRGINWQDMRRSANVEDRTREAPRVFPPRDFSYDTDPGPMWEWAYSQPEIRNRIDAAEAAHANYIRNLPRTRLGLETGLADLESPGYMERLKQERIARERRERERRTNR